MPPRRPPVRAQSQLPGSTTSALAIATYAATIAPTAPAMVDAGHDMRRLIATAAIPPSIMARTTPGAPRTTVHATTPPTSTPAKPTNAEQAPVATLHTTRRATLSMVGMSCSMLVGNDQAQLPALKRANVAKYNRRRGKTPNRPLSCGSTATPCEAAHNAAGAGRERNAKEPSRNRGQPSSEG